MGSFLVSLLSTLLAIPAVTGFIACVLFVIFGQVTVRKLRKNPETKQALGIEFASGWNILNVAQALALPQSVAQKIRRRSMGLEADPDVLYRYTTTFDRVLARIFYILFVFSGSGFAILVILNWLQIFD